MLHVFAISDSFSLCACLFPLSFGDKVSDTEEGYRTRRACYLLFLINQRSQTERKSEPSQFCSAFGASFRSGGTVAGSFLSPCFLVDSEAECVHSPGRGR